MRADWSRWVDARRRPEARSRTRTRASGAVREAEERARCQAGLGWAGTKVAAASNRRAVNLPMPRTQAVSTIKGAVCWQGQQGRSVREMKVLIFGATGMVGQGILRACLEVADVEQVLLVGRSPAGATDAKVRELLLPDLARLEDHEENLRGFDACLFPLGISSSGLTESDYTRVTYDLTVGIAETLARANPGMRFLYVSGAGTDSTEKGRTMWARVKGRTENALLRLPLDAYMFRPGLIRPMDGIRSRTRIYRLVYALLSPVLPLMERMLPSTVISTRVVGRAMVAVARSGYGKRILVP